MSENINIPVEVQEDNGERIEVRHPSPEAVGAILDHAGIEAPQITNFAEAKALKKFQDAQVPEAQAAAAAMAEQQRLREDRQKEELDKKARQLAANPNAITGIPDNLK